MSIAAVAAFFAYFGVNWLTYRLFLHDGTHRANLLCASVSGSGMLPSGNLTAKEKACH
jgi:hypothetical protein